MKCAFVRSVLILALTASVFAQDQGVMPEWDIRNAITGLRGQLASLGPYMEQVDPATWSDQNAPEAYATQWQALRNEIGYLDRALGELSQNPNSLAKSVESFLRMLSVEEMMDSFLAGVRRYHNPAIADLLTGIMNEGSDERAGMRRYLLELSTQAENECAVARQEAQRCRTELLSRPPSSGR